MGEYNVIGSDDWAGWGKTLEGPCLVQRRNGSYVIYLDNYEEHQRCNVIIWKGGLQFEGQMRELFKTTINMFLCIESGNNIIIVLTI